MKIINSDLGGIFFPASHPGKGTGLIRGLLGFEVEDQVGSLGLALPLNLGKEAQRRPLVVGPEYRSWRW